jgi:hypothetical protein
MDNQIEVRRISQNSLFKIMLIGFSTVCIPSSILCGMLSLFGAEAIHWNNQPITGVAGLLASLILGPLLALFFAFLSSFAWLGLWVYSKFSTMIIRYTPIDES